MIEPKGSVSRSSSAPVTNTQARKTALVVAIVLFLIAAWNLYRGRSIVVVVFASIGLSLLLVGFLWPSAARRFHIFWMKIAVFLGFINSRILLTLIYYGVFTPYGIISRLVGRDTLMRRSATEESYWTKRKTTRQSTEGFERLF